MIESCMILDGVELPYPPSVNHYWKAGRDRSGRPMRYLTKAANDFKRVVGLLCGRKSAFSGRVGVKVLVYPPDRRIRDLDNLLKGINDSIMSAGVIVDDCQIDEIQMRRMDVRKGGMIQVWVWEVSE
jgi:crossover junction endodeoxyribonuclease RusA